MEGNEWPFLFIYGNLYLDHISGDAIPQRQDALVFDNLCETVNHPAEMDVHSAEMWEARALSLKQGEGEKEEKCQPKLNAIGED